MCPSKVTVIHTRTSVRHCLNEATRFPYQCQTSYLVVQASLIQNWGVSRNNLKFQGLSSIVHAVVLSDFQGLEKKLSVSKINDL